MYRRAVFGVSLLAALAGWPCLSLANPPQPTDCRAYSAETQRALLARKLERDGYSTEQSKFLMWLSDQKPASIKDSCLTDEGRRCGVNSVRGMMIQCARDMLEQTLIKARSNPEAPSLDEMKPATMYGRTQFAVRELLAVAMIEACSGGVKERFFSLPQKSGCLVDMNATPP